MKFFECKTIQLFRLLLSRCYHQLFVERLLCGYYFYPFLSLWLEQAFSNDIIEGANIKDFPSEIEHFVDISFGKAVFFRMTNIFNGKKTELFRYIEYKMCRPN